MDLQLGLRRFPRFAYCAGIHRAVATHAAFHAGRQQGQGQAPVSSYKGRETLKMWETDRNCRFQKKRIWHGLNIKHDNWLNLSNSVFFLRAAIVKQTRLKHKKLGLAGLKHPKRDSNQYQQSKTGIWQSTASVSKKILLGSTKTYSPGIKKYY